ncbi:23S rRNA (pseudouridine(1915)-N(3))-methyltransferase RlmH [Spiroplasma turonicum]|uniref:Ribosomal RNA large subunit methyltransferase H n=1 Tax=Spiroplasma turonicum TaxID=216946 RepID=A0A0K1P6Y6_9MOLU|nr:23S rRNA (pseudouridine(1915)-N(3))-methyltransferase RlmH [Spiroplasma turonicum]AKU80071.1 rRNA large subunit methyltransferase [Spiroplasma turonicum]ALX71073.1 23S rRNA (pseudouridine1915-N3)-methyltransferase [Spiroplasma turonicum]
MPIKLIYFNKTSKEYEIINDFYLKKIKLFDQIDLIEIKELDFGNIKDNMNKNEYNISERISKLKDYDIYLLDISSKQVDSLNFAEIIRNNFSLKSGKLCFIIGPSDGFSDNFKKNYKNKISFGKITLAHQLIRVVLLEQIYRAFKIINNQKYHK